MYGVESDFWSVGVIAYECLMGKHPLIRSGMQTTETITRIVNYKVWLAICARHFCALASFA